MGVHEFSLFFPCVKIFLHFVGPLHKFYNGPFPTPDPSSSMPDVLTSAIAFLPNNKQKQKQYQKNMYFIF